MSLKDCIKQAGKNLNSEDRALLQSYLKEGMTDAQALTALEADIQGELQNIIDESGIEPKMVAGVSIEVAPDPADVQATNRFNTLTEAQKRSVTHGVALKMIPKAMEYLGVKDYTIQETTGGFENEVNPSLVVTSADGDLTEIGALLGYIGSQDSVVVYNEDQPGGTSVIITPPGDLTFEQQGELYRELHEAIPEVGGYTWRDGAMVIGNFSDMSDADFLAAIKKVTSDHHDVSTRDFYSDLLETKDYEQRDSFTDLLKEEFNREFNRAVRLHYAQRFENTDGRENGVLVRPPIKNGQTTITHFSNTQGLDTIDPEFYGTNYPGAEKSRTSDESWLPRVYMGFEPNTKGGYNREPGVGSHQYDVNIPIRMMYDFNNDPDGLWEGTKQTTPTTVTWTEDAKTGTDFRDFFSSVTKGTAGLPTLSSDYKPVMQSVIEELKDESSDMFRYNEEYVKHKGDFDQHIALSIPGFRDLQYRIGNAIVEVFGDGGVMLDIGASEGTQAKTITALSDGKIKSISLDPNPDMRDSFETVSTVEGASYSMSALGMDSESEGEYAGWDENGEPINNFDPQGQKFDIVHEAMVFQFIDNNRQTHVKRVAELTKDDGIAIFQEKLHNDQWDENEAKKNSFKSQSFAKEDMDAKSAEVLEGMNKHMVRVEELEKQLAKNFKWFVQIWDSGNFKGYAASNDHAKLMRFKKAVGDTSSDYSTVDVGDIRTKDKYENDNRASRYERAIYDAGYLGYWTNNRSLGMVAVSFEPLNVSGKGSTVLFQSSVALRRGRETLNKYGLKPGQGHKTRDVAAAMEARTREQSGTISRNDRSDESARKIARWMVQEVKFEMEHPEHSGVGWYSEKYQRAVDIMIQDFPELADDQNARDTLTVLIAVTSDGQKVGPNFKQAHEIYANYRKTGKFVSGRGHVRQASINNNLKILQGLYDTMGSVEEVHQYLMREETVRDMKKRAAKDGVEFKTDYPVDMKLPMAALVLGPKLGAFYGNLMGAHGYLTMDRWWSRTINRYRGTLLTKPTRQGKDRFKGLLGRPEMSDDEVLLAVIPYAQAYEKRKHSFKEGGKPSGYKTRLEIEVGRTKGKMSDEKWAKIGAKHPELYEEDTIERAANTIYKAAYVNLEDAPFNSSDRKFMVAAVNHAQKSLKRAGIEMSIADVQATLWYYEKRLYGEMGAKMTADISYEEAAMAAVGEKVKPTKEPEDFLVLNQSAWHGTPHQVDKFKTERIGTGEGHQAYGYGLYFAGLREVAEWYREKLSNHTSAKVDIDGVDLLEYALARKPKSWSDIDVENWVNSFKYFAVTGGVQQAIDKHKRKAVFNGITSENTSVAENRGHLYAVELAPGDHEYLLWDVDFKDQPQNIQDALTQITGKSADYFEAIGMTGSEVYRKISAQEGGGKEASEYLHSLGVRGIKYLDGSSRNQGDGSYNYVIFHEEDVEITEQYDQFQRGRIYLNDTSRIIQLTEKSDLSSFLHESGHLFLEMEKVFAREYGLSDNQKAILEWLGVDSFDDITDEMHERWAETFEVYLREGKAPSLGLRRAFAAFARWLKVIYRTLIDGRLARADLSPEITEIFDRLLATQAEIEEAAANPAYDQYFRSQEQAGMSDAKWKEYQATASRMKDTAERTLDEKVLEQYMKSKRKEWADEKAPLIAEERESLSKLPVYQIQGDLKPIKDDDGTVIAEGRFDTDKFKALFPDGKIPDRFIGKHVKEGGVDPAEYAEQHNYPSATAMVKDIMEQPTLNEAADQAAEARMVEKHGDILNDGTLEQEVREALINEDQAKLLMMEINALSRKPGINREYLKSEAAAMIASMEYKKIQPNKYYRAMIKAAKDSVNAEDPVDLKIRELTNHYLYKEAMRVKEQMEKHRRYIRQAQKSEYDTKKIDSNYAQQRKMLAEMYDVRVDPKKRKANLNQILDFYYAQISPKTDGVPVKDPVELSLLDPQLIRALEHREREGNLETFELIDFDQLKAEDLHGVVDMLKHLNYVGKQVAELNSDELIAERMKFVEHLRKKGGKDHPVQAGRVQPFKDVREEWNYLVNTMPSLVNMIRKLDGHEDGGMASELILQVISDAEAHKMGMQEAFFTEMEDMMQNVAEVNLSRMDGRTFELENGGTITRSSEEVFMTALYWGTESSREAIMEHDDLTEADVMKMMSTLTPDQLQLVNTVWAVNESQWPQLREASIEMVGFAPPKLDAKPFVVNGVQMTGGHMQLYYDATRVELNNEQESGHRTSTIVPTKAGTLNARVGSGGQPVLLDISNIVRSTNDKIHYIAYAKVGRRLRQIINHDDVRAVIEKKHGRGFYKAFIGNIDAITSARAHVESHRTLAKINRWVRQSATLMHLAFSPRNTVQQVGAIPIVVAEVGAIPYAQMNAQFLGKPREFMKNVDEMSAFMRNRAQVVNRDTREAMRQIVTTNKVVKRYRNIVSRSFVLQTLTDSAIAYPTWMAKFNREMEKHGDKKRAILEADNAVGRSVGSGSDMHLGRIMQSNQSEWIKTITMFGSWFNAYYQRLYRATKGGEDFMTVAFAVEGVLLPIIVANMTQALILDTPDDDETMAGYLTKNTLLFLAGTLPIIRQLGSFFEGFTPVSPVDTIPASTVRAYREVDAYIDGRQTGLKMTTDVGKAITSVVPVPGSGTIWRAMDYVDAWLEGEEDGFNPYQMVTEGRDRDG